MIHSQEGTKKEWDQAHHLQNSCSHHCIFLQDWSANPLFERKDNKKDALLDLDGRMVNLNKRYTAVKEAGVKIQAMVAVRTCLAGLLTSHSLFPEGRGKRQP